MQPRALLLDAMGTLVHLDEPAPRLARELGRRFGARVEVEQAGVALRAEIAYYRAHLDEGTNPDRLAALRTRCAIVLLRALPPLPALAAVAPEAMTEALLAALRFTAYPDAARALTRARRAGARLVVVSNWDVSLEAVLTQVGLAGRLDGIVTSASVAASKPDPAIFAAALAAAGVPPEACLHVGDSLAEDVAGARAARIEAVLLDRSGAPAPAPAGVRVVTSLDELVWTQ